MYVVAGVTGHTGRVVASTLLEKGEAVRVLVRSAEKGEPWKARGAEVAVASLDDADGIARALAGAKGFYLLVPPDMKSSDLMAYYRRIAGAASEALRRNPVERGVYLSTVGAHREDGAFPMHLETERTLRSLDTPFTLLRPSAFLENTLGSLPLVKGQGILPSFFPPDVKLPMVATQDIGETAAKELLKPGSEARVLELTGPEDYSMADVAAAYGRALGKPVEAVLMPPEQIVPTLLGAGLSEEMANFMKNMVVAGLEGRVTMEGGEVKLERGHVTVDEFADKVVAST